jgi:hypothetical protein
MRSRPGLIRVSGAAPEGLASAQASGVLSPSRTLLEDSGPAAVSGTEPSGRLGGMNAHSIQSGRGTQPVDATATGPVGHGAPAEIDGLRNADRARRHIEPCAHAVASLTAFAVAERVHR